MTAPVTVMTCQTCNGAGEAYATRFSGFLSACRECDGEGHIEIPADEWVEQ